MTKREKKKKKKDELVSFFFCSHFCASFEMILHGKIRNDNVWRKTALQCWNSVATIGKKVATMLQRCVSLEIVVVNRPAQHHH